MKLIYEKSQEGRRASSLPPRLAMMIVLFVFRDPAQVGSLPAVGRVVTLIRPGERVLDMGCGAGRHAFALERRGPLGAAQGADGGLPRHL